MADLCVSLSPASVTGAAEAAAMAVRLGAGMVEFRLDLLQPGEPVEELFAALRVPAIAACRFSRDGGAFRGSLEDRRTLMQRAVAGGAAWLDLEHWEEWLPPREGGDRARPRILRSYHDLRGTPKDLMDVQSRLLSMEPDALKIATTAWDLSEAGPLVELWTQKPPPPVPLVAFAMGRRGFPTRLLCLRFGAPFTYVAAGEGEETAAGQPSLRLAAGLYRAARVGSGTHVFGVVGGALAHSLSPVVHNRALRALGFDAVYLPLETDKPTEVFAMLPHEALGGLSVTAPHKERMLDVVEGWDADVEDTGVLNTVAMRDGRPWGHNTDVQGIQAALQQARDPAQDLAGMRGLVLGTGGAARAAVVALQREGLEVRLAGRGRERIKAFARRRDVEVVPLAPSVVEAWAPDVVVHATPVGGPPHEEESLLPGWRIAPGTLVLDMVSSPARTALLRRVEQAGGRPVSGLVPFLHQAAAQLLLWTGRDVEVAMLARYLGSTARDVVPASLGQAQ